MLTPMLLVLAALIIWPSVSLFLPRLIVLAAVIVWPEVSLFLPRLIVPEMLK
jgi:hypothetical protein